MPTLKKTKFGRKAIEDDESSCGSTEEMAKKMDLGTILIGTIPIALKCSTISLTLLDFLKSKEMEKSLVEVEKEHSPIDEKHSKRVITIDSYGGNKTQKEILEKPTKEMTKHIRPLYVRAHFNGKPVSKVFVNNGSIVNVMLLRMLRALGRNIDNLIETKVSVSAFIEEISKTLGVLPIDIMGPPYQLSL